MKTKRITKPEARAFLKALAAEASRLGFQPYPPDPDFPKYDCQRGRMWIVTDAGTYTLNVPDASDPIQIDLHSGNREYWITGRFSDPEARVDAAPYGSNPCNGKWNFYGYTAEQAIGQLLKGMALVNARPPTPEEGEAFRDAEAARLAVISARRRELDDYIALSH